MKNNIILKQMIRLSRIIKDSKEARAKLASINAQTEYFIYEGENTSILKQCTNNSINNCLYVEKYLHLSVSNLCKALDGFNSEKMEPVDYICSHDIKNKFIDLCRGKEVVATINLTTGKIEELKPEVNED